ncbi:MAG TPA: glycosyltransferase, partial [Microbacteriaceae bacterium]|nr:glycosyltransferase [Microbacteriaceae bacterium]
STAGSGAAKPYTWDAGVAAVDAHLARVGIDGAAARGRITNTVRISRRLPAGVRVSVIIPTNGASGRIRGRRRVHVLGAVRSLLARAGHEALEVVVVWDSGMDRRILDRLRRIAGDRLVLVEYDRPFNFSEKCNLGFLASSGDVVVLLNDDIEVLSDRFVAELCAPLLEPGVGMTGAALSYEDGSVQHGGHVYADHGWAEAYRGAGPDEPGYFFSLRINREVAGVTAACAALTRARYAQIGGLDTGLPGNFNDVDLSYKVRRTGGRILWLAEVRATHFESRTRDRSYHPAEAARLVARWGLPERDPYLAQPWRHDYPADLDDQVRRPATIAAVGAPPA